MYRIRPCEPCGVKPVALLSYLFSILIRRYNHGDVRDTQNSEAANMSLHHRNVIQKSECGEHPVHRFLVCKYQHSHIHRIYSLNRFMSVANHQSSTQAYFLIPRYPFIPAYFVTDLPYDQAVFIFKSETCQKSSIGA